MKSGWNILKPQKGRLLRLVAMLFLAHAGVDLLFPQLCSEEGFRAGVNTPLAVSYTKSNKDSPAVSAFDSNESREEQRSDQEPRDEDCFCCCSHVVPSPVFGNPNNAELHLPSITEQNVSILSAPLKNPYHPPRLV